MKGSRDYPGRLLVPCPIPPMDLLSERFEAVRISEGVKIPAGWMIDQCGWQGKALGPAAVHDKQALVLVNLGGATGKDVVALSDAVRASVKEKFGVEICPEVNFIE